MDMKMMVPESVSVKYNNIYNNINWYSSEAELDFFGVAHPDILQYSSYPAFQIMPNKIWQITQKHIMNS